MTSTDVVQRTPMQDVLATVRSPLFIEQIKNALPGNVTAERFVRCAVTAIQQTPALIAADRDSLFQSIVKCAQVGLIPDGREAAFVEVKIKGEKKVQFWPMVGGYRKIAAKNGFTLVADVVREKDAFEWSRVPPTLKHTPTLGEDRGEILYAYAVAFDRNWRFVTAPVVMDVAEIEKVRKVSRAATSEYGPWVNWYDRMCCKTVTRRLFNELPLGDLDEVSSRIRDAADDESDLPDLNRMTLDEANVAAPLAQITAPQDAGPDDGDVIIEEDAGTAAATLVPKGVYAERGLTIGEVAELGREGEAWLLSTLKKPRTDADLEAFRDALEVFVKLRLPAVWEQFVAWREEQTS